MDEELIVRVYVLFWLAVLGSVAGSFADCMVSRYLRGENVFLGRSRCQDCGRVLGVKDLVPVFSYLAGRGRCRYCGGKIPKECLVAELAGAMIYVGMGIRFGISEELIMWILAGSLLLLLSLVDVAKRIIPDAILFWLAAIRILFVFILREPFLDTAVSMAAGACLVPGALLILVLLADHLTQKESMGGGDIKLLFVLGLYLDWMQMLLLLLTASLLGILAALPDVLRKEKKAIAFGPFLSAGCFFVVWFGDPLLSWYRALF